MRPGKIFNSIKQRGQVLVLFALLIPIILIFVGLGIDIGWYYLNVSRLQNAADAAARAGAVALIKENPNMKNFYYSRLLAKPPTDLSEFNEVYYIKEVASTVSSDNTGGATYGTTETDAVLNSNKTYDKEEIVMSYGTQAAIEYAAKNLGHSADVEIKNSNGSTRTENWIFNDWNTSKDESNHHVNLETKLYSKRLDIDREKNGVRYYEVKLTEDVTHFFLPGWFKPMKATVVAYAILNPHGTDFVTTIDLLEKIKVIANWEYQNQFHNFTMNWNHYQDTKNHYKEGNDYRTEKTNVQESTAVATSANGNKKYTEDQVDSLNLDTKQDMNFSDVFNTDWDLGAENPLVKNSTTNRTTVTALTSTSDWNAMTTQYYAAKMRIHTSFNFTYAWKNRNLKKLESGNFTEEDLESDILWVRIESDPIWSELLDNNGKRFKKMSQLNSVRQFILNFNKDNTEVKSYTDQNGVAHNAYTKRPMFIFYMGPETYTKNTLSDATFSEDTSVRKSQPVLLNFNADYNAIIYMPNSPVIINGNGHKFTGFIIAKEYLKPKTEEDFSTSNGYMKAFDAYGHTIFFKRGDENVVSKEDVDAASEGYDARTDDVEGTIFLYEKQPRIILRLTASDIDTKTHSISNNYLSTTYKANLMKLRGITDENELSTVSFPDEGNNNTIEEYPVVTACLSDKKKSNDFVKVLLHNIDGTTTIKYIDKKDLPYVKVRQNGNRPYVSVYDLKKKRDKNSSGDFETGYDDVTIQDDALAEKNNGDNTNSDADTTKVRSVKSSLLNTYKTEYMDKNLLITKEDDCKYFYRSSVARYRKITHSGKTEYIKEETSTYYMKTVPDGAIEENYIIVDNYGNIQVKDKPLSDPSWNATRKTNENEQPYDIEKYKTIRIEDTDELHDYREMDYEVVYKKSVFNLSETSGYSYFQIADLKRKNYLYLNDNELNNEPPGRSYIEDMFFTTKRASWID